MLGWVRVFLGFLAVDWVKIRRIMLFLLIELGIVWLIWGFILQ
jgi:hypothetical protein